MKYLAVIAGAVVVGLAWQSEFGWFIVAIAAAFIINVMRDNDGTINIQR